jgi:hypothetical protein
MSASKLDFGQIIRRCFDEAADALRVEADITANISGAQEVIISSTDDSIALGDTAGNLAGPVVDAAFPVMVMNSLVPRKYDYIAATYPTSTTEVYTFKAGGSSGTTVGTLTVTYSDDTKAQVSSVART